ncbi:MAG: hypothetical protein J5524_10890 [Bacteroidaceae bacterium]|nr:hypothetical protein [Bacteroidaceae bacterium]
MSKIPDKQVIPQCLYENDQNFATDDDKKAVADAVYIKVQRNICEDVDDNRCRKYSCPTLSQEQQYRQFYQNGWNKSI